MNILLLLALTVQIEPAYAVEFPVYNDKPPALEAPLEKPKAPIPPRVKSAAPEWPQEPANIAPQERQSRQPQPEQRSVFPTGEPAAPTAASVDRAQPADPRTASSAPTASAAPIATPAANRQEIQLKEPQLQGGHLPPLLLTEEMDPFEEPGSEANEASAEGSIAEGFISRSGELGAPLDVVPSLDERGAQTPKPASISFSKLAAGLLFLASLGLVGYRHSRRGDARVKKPERGYSSGSWLPPRKSSTPVSTGGFSMPASVWGEQSASSPGAGNFPLIKDARRRNSVETGRSRSSKIPFHSEIERRVKHTEVRGAGRSDYAQVFQMAAEGYTNREIASELGLSLHAVSAMLRLQGARTGGSNPPHRDQSYPSH